MTSQTRTAARSNWSRVVRPAAYLLGIAAASATCVALAFGTAKDEATRISQDFYDTTGLVMNFGWWWAICVLAVPVYFVARSYPRLAVVAFLTPVVPLCASAHIFFIRFGETGWGDGLEGLAYIYAGLATLTFAGVATWGFIAGRRRGASHLPLSR